MGESRDNVPHYAADSQESITGCYSLVLRCIREHPHHYYSQEFLGLDKSAAFRKAREAGWLINEKTGKVLCPEHSGKPVKRRHRPIL